MKAKTNFKQSDTEHYTIIRDMLPALGGVVLAVLVDSMTAVAVDLTSDVPDDMAILETVAVA